MVLCSWSILWLGACITVFVRWSCCPVVAPHELMRCASSVTFSIRDDHCSVQSSSRLMSTPRYLYDSCSVMCGMLCPWMVSWGGCASRTGPICSARLPPLRFTLVYTVLFLLIGSTFTPTPAQLQYVSILPACITASCGSSVTTERSSAYAIKWSYFLVAGFHSVGSLVLL